jgi:cytidine deaminase
MVADEPSPEELERLIAQAREVRERAWSPYSGFRVGAALLSDDGRIFTGCNVENASLGLTICAERAAVAKAVSEGATSFRCVVIVTGEESPSFPCGACRQVLSELGPEQVVVTVGAGDARRRARLDELLPGAFRMPPKGP